MPKKETQFVVFKHPNLLANDSMELKNNPVDLTYQKVPSANISEKPALKAEEELVEKSLKKTIEPMEVKTVVAAQCYSQPDFPVENTKKRNWYIFEF